MYSSMRCTARSLGGSLSGDVSVQGVSVQRRSLSGEVLCQGVSVQGGLSQGDCSPVDRQTPVCGR